MEVFDINQKDVWENAKSYYQLHGYLVIDGAFNNEAIDSLSHDLDRWFVNDSFPSSDFSMKNSNRIQDAWLFDNRVKQIAINSHILTLLRFLYDDQNPRPFQTLNFRNGTQQPAHSDSIHFNSEPFGMMCGVWIALEDIGEDQGPLIFYPGSHKYPEMNFAELGLKPEGNNFKAYSKAIKEFILNEKLTPKYGTLKKGQALIWAANILHGGSKRKSDKTRLSQVTHYYFENCKYWRPSLSYEKRHYFKPNWISKDTTPIIEKVINENVLKTKRQLKRLFSSSNS